jgi:zinc protease
MLKNIEQQYNEKDKTESGSLVWDYVSNFLDSDPIPGIEFEYNYAKENLNSITLEEVNQLSAKWISDKNRLILVESIEKDGIKIPGEKEIAAITEGIHNEKIEPLAEKEFNQPLMGKIPAPGKIKHSKYIEKVNITEITLANGAKIILKPTDFQNDEIRMTAFREGGQSVFPENYNWSATFSSRCISDYGLEVYSKSDLEKVLAGKNVSVSPYIDTYYEGFKGSSSKSDLETMFQLINLYFTSPRFDESAYDSYIGKQKQYYKNLTLRPEINFFNQAQKFRYNNNPRTPGIIPTDSAFNTISFDKINKVFKDRFSDVNGFTFIFVGSFSIEKIKPLLETYIGSLPGKKNKNEYIDLGIRPINGPDKKNIYLGSDPKSYIYLFFDNKLPSVNKDDEHLLWSLGQILKRIYIDKLREEMGEVYSINVSSNVERYPYLHYELEMIIPCSPDNADTLVKAARAELNRVITKGLTKEEIQKEIETQTRTAERDSKENKSCLSKVERVYKVGEDFSGLENPYLMIKLLTPENLQRVAKKYLNINKFVRVSLYPENYKSR